jgi:hypothetical protein
MIYNKFYFGRPTGNSSFDADLFYRPSMSKCVTDTQFQNASDWNFVDSSAANYRLRTSAVPCETLDGFQTTAFSFFFFGRTGRPLSYHRIRYHCQNAEMTAELSKDQVHGVKRQWFSLG